MLFTGLCYLVSLQQCQQLKSVPLNLLRVNACSFRLIEQIDWTGFVLTCSHLVPRLDSSTWLPDPGNGTDPRPGGAEPEQDPRRRHQGFESLFPLPLLRLKYCLTIGWKSSWLEIVLICWCQSRSKIESYFWSFVLYILVRSIWVTFSRALDKPWFGLVVEPRTRLERLRSKVTALQCASWDRSERSLPSSYDYISL